jgi:hypothetical protein
LCFDFFFALFCFFFCFPQLFSTRVASKLGITAPRIGFFRKSANAHIVDALARAQNALGTLSVLHPLPPSGLVA